MNKKMWNLYKDSENGKKTIELFNPDVEDVTKAIKNLFEYAKKWGSDIEPDAASFWLYQIAVNFKGDELNSEKDKAKGAITRLHG